MFPALSDTIAAIATAPGNGGIGVLRLSGENAHRVLHRVFRPNVDKPMKSAHLRHGRFVDPTSGAPLDDVLAACFFAPHSYTGQDSAEIHAHGGRLLLRQLLLVLLREGARMAEPGEFTWRAYRLGKLDLTRAEAVRALIDAPSEVALNASRRLLMGELGRFAEQIRGQLLDFLAYLEAYIDFPDEPLPSADLSVYGRTLQAILADLDAALAGHERARLAFDGVSVAIVGEPNVGKSSLLNRLVHREAAIVSPLPGTTRDIIEAPTTLAGLPLRMADTAGVRAGADTVEALGIERALARMDDADVIIWVWDTSQPWRDPPETLLSRLQNRRVIIAMNKGDLPPQWEAARITLLPQAPRVPVSAKLGTGLEALEAALAAILETSAADALLIADARQADALHRAVEAVRRTQAGLGAVPPELLAADLREALAAFDDLLGVTTPDDVLERVFSRFCIGK